VYDDIEALASSEKNEKILAWISNTRVEKDHQTVRNQKLGNRYWNRGQWLLKHDEYIKWKTTQSGVLWLKGGVGSGKTCLVSIVIHQLFEGAMNERLGYFYCSRKSQKSDPVDIVRSLTSQLAYTANHTSIFKAIMERYNQRNNPNLDLSLEAWVSILIDLIMANGETTIVIDALDECPRSYELLRCLKRLYDSSPHVRIFLSSRPGEESVVEHFTSPSCITISGHRNSHDIRFFVASEIADEERLFHSGIKNRPDLAGKLGQILDDRGQWM
jgi:hypothetical protein